LKSLDLKLEELIHDELNKLQRKKPFVENIEVSYEHSERGMFHSKVKARIRNKTLNLFQEGRCAESAIRKLFTTLKRQLERKTYVKPKRFKLNLQEAA